MPKKDSNTGHLSEVLAVATRLPDNWFDKRWPKTPKESARRFEIIDRPIFKKSCLLFAPHFLGSGYDKIGKGDLILLNPKTDHKRMICVSATNKSSMTVFMPLEADHPFTDSGKTVEAVIIGSTEVKYKFKN